MDVSGIIFACVDCDADAVEDWNRWYDLEHLPPNIALPGIMSGRRYVAPPALHEVREPARRLEGFADGRGVHVTVYTLHGDPAQVRMTQVFLGQSPWPDQPLRQELAGWGPFRHAASIQYYFVTEMWK